MSVAYFYFRQILFRNIILIYDTKKDCQRDDYRCIFTHVTFSLFYSQVDLNHRIDKAKK